MLQVSTVKSHLDVKSTRTSIDQQLIDIEARAVGILEHETGLVLTAQEPHVVVLDSSELGPLYLPGIVIGTPSSTNPEVKIRASLTVLFSAVTAKVLDTDFSLFTDRDRRATGMRRLGTTWPTGTALVQASVNLGYEEGGTAEPPSDVTMAVLDLCTFLFRNRVEKRQVDEPTDDSGFPPSVQRFIDQTVPWSIDSSNVKVLALG